MDLADDVTISGYGDVRLVAPTGQASWINGGLGKFRYGGGNDRVRFAEAVAQIDWHITDALGAISLLRAEQYDRNGVDALETYLRYAPHSDGDFSRLMKAGAFFPTISLENDDLGWSSPYTLTPSAINSWIGDELRTIGSEASASWKTDAGTLSLLGAVTCCNDGAGILIADHGWTMEDRPTGLFDRVRLPTATQALFHAPLYANTGLFNEIDGHPGWYAGAAWQMDGIGKINVVRYDNEGDPYDKTSRDTAWDTRFWSAGARTQLFSVSLIAQALRGDTVVAGPGFVSHT